jgi:hypothetical protein
MQGRARLAAMAAAVTLAGGALTSVPAAAVDLTAAVPEDVITTDNVEYHGTIPLDAPGVGGEVVVRPDLGGKRYFYVTGAYGLGIYDTTDPLLPMLVGRLPFPISQNEDLKVSADGKRAVIANDGSLPYSPNSVTNGVHIVDTTDVTNPKIIGSTSARVRGTGTDAGPAEHTVTCAEAACEWLYGSSGRIYDARNPLDIKELPNRWNRDRAGKTVSAHALNRDETGLLIADTNPRMVIDTIGLFDPAATPASPVVLAQGNRPSQDSRLQHNNIRTQAAQWQPRDPGDPVLTRPVTANPRSVSVTNDRPVLRPGELLISTSESNINPTCDNAGALSTWSIANFDKGADPKPLEVFRPLNGTWVDGSPAAQWAGCSAHWFTEQDGYVTAGWYEHGTRFFKIDQEVGTITEVGYFQPVNGVTSAAYWITDSVVYTVDGTRGIDILTFDKGTPPPSQEELDASWMRSMGRTSSLGALERYTCRLAATRQ